MEADGGRVAGPAEGDDRVIDPTRLKRTIQRFLAGALFGAGLMTVAVSVDRGEGVPVLFLALMLLGAAVGLWSARQ